MCSVKILVKNFLIKMRTILERLRYNVDIIVDVVYEVKFLNIFYCVAKPKAQISVSSCHKLCNEYSDVAKIRD